MTLHGNGTIEYPQTLATALANTSILPGHTLWLRGGTYKGNFVSSLAGESDNPIIIKPYQNEKPIIDGSLTINGQYQLWQDIEVMYSGWVTRTSEFTGSVPNDVPTTKGFSLLGVGNVANGLIVHDTAGNGALSGGTLSLITGCLFYNNGWSAPDRGHGHSMYVQNINGRKIIKRSISCNSFGYAWHAYTEGGKINYIDYIETTCINAGKPVAGFYEMLTGGYVPAIEPRWYRNMTYNCGANIGYVPEGGAVDAIRIGNYLPFGCSEHGAINYVENTGNTLTKPISGTKQFCYVDEYKNTKGFLTLYNWDLSNFINADLTDITGLSIGDTVRLRCAEDYFNCYQDLVIDANRCVTVDMRAMSHTVATAIAHDYTPPTTCPEFGSYIVEKQ